MTPEELYKYYLTQYTKPSSEVSPVSPLLTVLPTGQDDTPGFSTPFATNVKGLEGLESFFGTFMGLAASSFGGPLGKAVSLGLGLADPKSITAQAFDKVNDIFGLGFSNPFSSGDSTMSDGPFGGYNDFTGTEGTFSTDTSNTGATQSNQNSVDTDAQDADQSGGPAGSTSGTDAAGDGGDGYATGGRVNYLQGGLTSLLGNYYGKR